MKKLFAVLVLLLGVSVAFGKTKHPQKQVNNHYILSEEGYVLQCKLNCNTGMFENCVIAEEQVKQILEERKYGK